MTRATRIRRTPGATTRHGRRGQALVEFALVLPVFLLLLFGLIDVGRYVYMNSVLSQAAREGARLAAVEASWIGNPSGDASCNQPNGPVCPGGVTGTTTPASLQSDVVAAVNRMVAPFGPVPTASVFISCGSAPGPTGAWTGQACPSSGRQSGTDVVSVRVVLTFSPITPIVSSILGSITTSGSATMVIN